MSLGPILGSAGLAIMIPPSSLAVVLGVVAELSIGKILMGIIVPGLLMAVLYSVYILLRCTLQPYIAPSFDVEPVPLPEKLQATVGKHSTAHIRCFFGSRRYISWYCYTE